MRIKSENGFSLLEITVVLTIIGAIIAIAAPRLFDKKSETRKVLRDFIENGRWDFEPNAALRTSGARLLPDPSPD